MADDGNVLVELYLVTTLGVAAGIGLFYAAAEACGRLEAAVRRAYYARKYRACTVCKAQPCLCARVFAKAETSPATTAAPDWPSAAKAAAAAVLAKKRPRAATRGRKGR